MLKTTMAAACALMIAPLVAHAQVTYRCTTSEGKKYYGSAIPMQCMGHPIEQLNAQGLVIRRIDPEGEEKARAEKAAAAAKSREEESANREEQRRNRALLATYTSERDIEDARHRALADNQSAVREVETKIDEIKKRRAGYDKEMEFYQDTKKGTTKAPAQLLEDIKNAEIDLKAQEGLLAAKRKEVEGINAKYDEDKKRYIQLTKGQARR
jgi:chromosome segregation ATPase